jgi:hypothetical protein
MPRAALGGYRAVAPRAGPVASALYGEEASEEDRTGAPAPDSRIAAR